MKIELGDTVAFNGTYRHIIPAGRQNNKTARVIAFLSDIEGGVLLDRDLHGLKYWNLSDLKKV